MSNKKVAGTIMLNLNDGSKKFLVHPDGESMAFVTTKVSEDMTGLASMLQFFKEEIQLDVTSINLVELTNAHTDAENMPLFVFEMNEEHMNSTNNDSYVWEKPSELKNLLASYDIQGVPMF
ncbi:hypothetical protein BCR24_11415 [Enterococcus ureilyticus]|uniref:Uncharacterized protein n=1 Tax=Enterococcus ureilyticus TaxID=1131292 RepID=A0A1E5HFA2_9ENTE|nr:hypothetical protein [Enterococcus ureilyticus]MBM7689367.1 hypothetical protein [Enterococcus ureilyticus]OEG23632.1 hypothetical protein BCR24_11415 [Enterococcus ureilyticus]